jgi:hypothetical protein
VPVIGYQDLEVSPLKFNYRAGISNKNHKILIARRLSASTSFGAESWKVTKVPGLVQFDYKYNVLDRTYYNRISGDLTRFTTWPALYSGDISDIDDVARTQFLSRCYRAQHSFQGGVFLGELKEAVHMIRHPLDSLVNGMSDYLKALRRRKRRGIGHGRRLKDMIANTWLEYVFGWGPLLNDIDSGAKALARAIAYRAPTEHVTGSAKKSFQVHGSLEDIFSPDGSYMFVSYKPITSYQVSVKYEGGVYAKNGGNGAVANLSDFGVDFQSFLPTVWELIPYSFLVDYVSNVGQFIEALSFALSDLIYATQSVSSSVIRTAGDWDISNNIEHDDSFKILNQQFNPGSAKLEGRSFIRSDVISSIGLPSLTITLENLNFRRGANISALGAAAASTSRFLNH